MEILTDLPYEEVAQIFVRVNSGGRSLKTTDLALATLSSRWPGILHEIEGEARHWRQRHYGDLDVTFITRALTGAVLGRGLSAWSHGRLVNARQERLDAGWASVKQGLRHLVPLLQGNLGVTHSRLLPSVNVLLPLVVLLGERPDEPLDAETADGIVYWFLVATLRNRYSGSADTLLGLDVPAARQDDPVRALLANLGVAGTRVSVTEQALLGRSVASPYFFASFSRYNGTRRRTGTGRPSPRPQRAPRSWSTTTSIRVPRCGRTTPRPRSTTWPISRSSPPLPRPPTTSPAARSTSPCTRATGCRSPRRPLAARGGPCSTCPVSRPAWPRRRAGSTVSSRSRAMSCPSGR